MVACDISNSGCYTTFSLRTAHGSACGIYSTQVRHRISGEQLVLAAVGLYGVTAYSVERRTNEIGVRIALGANRGGVIRMVLRGAFLQILIGLLIGIPASIGCARLIASQLYEVQGWDPLVLGGSIASLAICALLASIIPARRAASINPVVALRVE